MYPVIKAPDRQTRRQFHLDLFYTDNDAAQLPVITFESADKKPIVDPDEHGITGGEMVKRAFRNLAAEALALTTREVNGTTLLVADGHLNATSKILDKAFLREAADKLGTARIAIGLPVSDCILIVPADDYDAIDALEQTIYEYFTDYTRTPISTLVYIVEDGTIVDTGVTEERKVEVAERALPEGFDSNVFTTKLFGALYNIKMIVGADTPRAFKNGILISLVNALQEHIGNDDFNGTIELHSEVGRPGKSKEQRKDIGRFLSSLSDQPNIKAVLERGDKKVKLDFLFGEDFQRGDVHHKLSIQLS